MLRPPRSSRRRVPRTAFTLIELMAVVAILGLFAAVTTVTVRGSIAASRRHLEWQRLQSMDTTLRSQCCRLRQPATVRVSLEKGTWTRHLSGMPPLVMAQTSGLTGIAIHGQAARTGEVALLYRADGTSDSYAIQLAGDDTEVWRLICGGTGQWNEEQTYASVRSLQ